MNNKEYWIKREQQKLNNQIKDVEALENKLKQEFIKASKEIEKEIFSLFIKYSEDNNLNYAQASQLLTSKEFKEWKYDLKGYIKLIEQTGDEQLLLELNTLAMKSRISRLEEMLYQINKHIDETFKSFKGGVYDLLEDTVSSSYYTTMYDLHKYIGVGSSFAFVDKNMIEEILSYPWSGLNYSERIWKNRDKLKNVIKEEITQMVIQGKGSREVAKNIAGRLNTSLSNAYRLVHTEHSYVMGEASARAYEECEVEKYQFLATLDNRTSKICQGLDLKIFNLKDRVVGENASPMHPRCRSTEIPYIERNISTRFARDSDGKGIKVPSDMTYIEWYDKFVKGNHKAEVAELKIRNKANDKKQYEKYKKILGKEVPKTFDKFQEFKYNDSKKWNLFKDYKKSRENNMISAFTSFKDYNIYKDRVEKELIGIKTSNGIEIKGQSKHFLERIFGTTKDPNTNRPREGVDIIDIKDALLNGKVRTRKTDINSIKFITDKCMVSVNPHTGNLIQVNPQ